MSLERRPIAVAYDSIPSLAFRKFMNMLDADESMCKGESTELNWSTKFAGMGADRKANRSRRFDSGLAPWTSVTSASQVGRTSMKVGKTEASLDSLPTRLDHDVVAKIGSVSRM